MKITDDQKKEQDRVIRVAGLLATAWERYTAFFGTPPHGTHKQLAAMLELIPGYYLAPVDKNVTPFQQRPPAAIRAERRAKRGER